jgi:hypothetical protein
MGGRQNFYFAVTCAPSRRIKPTPIEPRKALDFLNFVAPGDFAYPPTQSVTDSVSFEVSDDADGLPSFEPLRVARLWANGRVELMYRAAVTHNGEDEATIDVASSVVPAMQLARAVQAGWYRRLYGFSRFRRIDWLVQLSNACSDATRGWREWSDLQFAGREPSGRATVHHATAPTFGLGWRKLRSLPQSAAIHRILGPALSDLLRNSGWYDGPGGTVGDTVADVLAALAAEPVGQPASQRLTR